MALGIRITIKADDRAFKAALATLKRIRSPAYHKRAVRPAVNKTAAVLNKAMKAKARGVGPIEYITRHRGKVEIPASQLARSIGVRRKTYRGVDGWVVAVVGPRFGYTAPGGLQPSAFAIYVEGLEKSTRLVSEPSPFARPAVQQSKQAMRATFRRELVRGTAKVVGKLRASGSTV